MSTLIDAASEYFRALAGYHPRRANGVVQQLLDDGTPVEQIITQILAPAQVRVGELWESGRWSVADEHAATSIAEGALVTLAHATTPRQLTPMRHTAVVCAEGEWHSLPARMAAVVLAAQGNTQVTMLGPSLPADQLHRRLAVGDVDVLALSCTMPTNLIGAERCIAAAHDRGVTVVAGGSAFGPDPHRARSLGADAWAVDATTHVELAAEPGPRHSRSSAEVLLLDAVDNALISVAYDRLVGAFPRLGNMYSYQQARIRENLRWMARSTAAALMTDDIRIVEDLLASLYGHFERRVPSTVVTTSALLLAETLEPHSDAGAALLSRAAVTAKAQSLSATSDDGSV